MPSMDGLIEHWAGHNRAGHTFSSLVLKSIILIRCNSSHAFLQAGGRGFESLSAHPPKPLATSVAGGYSIL